MASAISAITLLSDLYGLRIQPAVNDASREETVENPQDWPSLSSFLAVVTSCGLRQYNQELFLEGLRSPHLGEGLDYSVDLCEDVTKAELVIVKHVKLTLPTTKSHEKVESPIIRRFRKVHTEIRIMAHPPLHGSKYILNLLGFGWEFAEQAYMAPFLVVEYARHGTLRDFLLSTSHRDFAQKYALAEDVARGLQALHRCEIVHGDIKMENVLVCGMEPADVCAKIADFGSSIIGAAESDYVYYYGTEQYNAPELRGDIVEKNEASSATVSMAYMLDVYAYGLLVWEVVNDGAQFFLREDVHLAAERKDFQVIWKLALQDCSSYESGHSEKGIFSKVIEHTLLVDPEKRWNVDSILRNFRNPEKDR
jgi:serine/threonine protein kinase